VQQWQFIQAAFDVFNGKKENIFVFTHSLFKTNPPSGQEASA
jgi:hypothetical protein